MLFWTHCPLVEVVGVERRKIINVDNFGVELNRCNSMYEWQVKFFCICNIGHYARTTKLTVLVGIEPGDERLPPHQTGSIENPTRWVQVVRGTGTTAEVFFNFLQTIIDSVENRSSILHQLNLPFNQYRVFLWDNLNSHSSPLVAMTLYGHPGPRNRFSSVNKPPYQSKYGSIEYKICDLIHELQMEACHDWDIDILEQEIYNAANIIGGFNDIYHKIVLLCNVYLIFVK